MRSPANNTIVLLDIDNTLINSKGHLNRPLLAALKSFKLTRIVLLTSYDLKYRLETSVKSGLTRWDVIRRLKYENMRVEAVIVSASPYSESQLGSYYKKEIQPQERRLRARYLLNPAQLLMMDELSAKSNAELHLIEENIVRSFGGIPCWQGDDFKGGKQHMITHVIQAYTKNNKNSPLDEIHRFIVLDDKREVIEVVRRAIKEETYGPQAWLQVLPINFTTVYSDPPHYYVETLASYFGISLPDLKAQILPNEDKSQSKHENRNKETGVKKIVGIDEDYLEIILDALDAVQNTPPKRIAWLRHYDHVVIWLKSEENNSLLERFCRYIEPSWHWEYKPKYAKKYSYEADEKNEKSEKNEIGKENEKNEHDILTRIKTWSLWYRNTLESSSDHISYTAWSLDATWLKVLDQELNEKEQLADKEKSFAKEKSRYHLRLGEVIKILNSSLQTDCKEEKSFPFTFLRQNEGVSANQQRRQYLELLLSYSTFEIWGWFLSTIWKSRSCEGLKDCLALHIASPLPAGEKIQENTLDKIKTRLLLEWSSHLKSSGLTLEHKDRGKLEAEIRKGKGLNYVQTFLASQPENFKNKNSENASSRENIALPSIG